MFIYQKYTTKDQVIYNNSLEIRNELLRAPIGKSIYSENLEIEKDNQFYGAFCNNNLVGTLSYFREEPQVAHLTAFAVKKEYQKKGIGRKLLEFLVNDLKENDFRIIKVDARKEAVPFYEKCGFVVKLSPIINKKLNVIDFEMIYMLSL